MGGYREERSIEGIDWITVFLYAALVLFGWGAIFAVGYKGGPLNILDFSSQHGKQMIWIGTSVILAIAILIINWKFYISIPYILYGVFIVLLIAALFLAPEVKGSRSWFPIGPVRFQPSEFAKFATALALAKYLTSVNVNLKDLKAKMIALGLILLPTALIISQGDTGSAVVFLGLFIVLYRQGFPATLAIFGFFLLALFLLTILFGKWYVSIALIVIFALIIIPMALNFAGNKGRIFLLGGIMAVSVAFSFFAVELVFDNVLEKHHQSRVLVLLGQEAGLGANYNVEQSKTAIASGGFMGKGYLEGTITKGEFVPEQSTDFIFSTLGEELGFLGTSLFIVLFVIFLLRLTHLGERQRSAFTKVYAYGVASIFFIHFMINIGMTIGLIPVVGIPLPFVSYGGSSLWGFTILLFILLKFDANRMLVWR